MMNIDASSLLPSIDSLQNHIPLTSTPKRSNKSSNNSQPLSSTLSISNDSCKQFELSISAITVVDKSHTKRRRCYQQRRRSCIHPSTIIKRIELKYLLYSTRAMKQQQTKQRLYTDAEMKIYVV
jgi:hypothetical protein